MLRETQTFRFKHLLPWSWQDETLFRPVCVDLSKAEPGGYTSPVAGRAHVRSGLGVIQQCIVREQIHTLFFAGFGATCYEGLYVSDLHVIQC